jgi:hypothetical protein
VRPSVRQATASDTPGSGARCGVRGASEKRGNDRPRTPDDGPRTYSTERPMGYSIHCSSANGVL